MKAISKVAKTIGTVALASALVVGLFGCASSGKKVGYNPGTYTGAGEGYNGPVELTVTFTDSAISDIVVTKSAETANIGSIAFPYLIEDALAANGCGIDIVSGATFSSFAFKNALADAATKAGVSNIDAFRKNKVARKPGAAIEKTFDVVVVGSGGAGMGAAVQSAQNGNTVIVVEKNAQIGGNTCASGGQFQSVMPYLVWDASAPDAKTGVFAYNGKTYNKLMSTKGYIDILKTIENWNEAAFDEAYYKTNTFEAGDINELSKHGVHAEYLPTLRALKNEIRAYLAWAQPKLDAGFAENEITLFSTVNLHIFQTYYGGLRPTADKSSWIYGDYELVSQFVEDAQGLKEWLEDQGALFDDDKQPTIIGALWDRENNFQGGDLDGDGKADASPEAKAVFGTYFYTTRNTLMNKYQGNEIMLRTTIEELVVEGGKVTGVKGKMYDGTPVTLKANKGVVLATGGFAANTKKVAEYNEYWSSKYLTDRIDTTNRSSLQGDGIFILGEQVKAASTGLNFTQLMPISWVDNGDLAFGAGTYAVYINPTTGRRFVDESAERDVLSLAEFENGIDHNGVKGVFLEIANNTHNIPGPYPYGVPGSEHWDDTVEWRQYTFTIDQLPDLLNKLGMTANPTVIRQTIEDYDRAVMGVGPFPYAPKGVADYLIGTADKDARGNYIPSSYKLDGVPLKARIMAPSTHHTMGGLVVDTKRHVLDKSGKIIPGLYAAGEVTGGFHGGNRLGGNAIVEIFVSGRTAANSITMDN